jgi:hypothetical protein
MAKVPEYHLAKIAPPGSMVSDYQNRERARDTYGTWMSGFTEDEVAKFYGIPVEEIERDIVYIQTTTPTRQIIAHQNDRNRILIQRQESQKFRELLKGALELRAVDFLAAGVSPAGILKEFREATGMTSRAEPLIQINTQQNFSGPPGQGAITSAEDVIRRVLDKIDQNNSPIIDVEAEPVQPSVDSEEDQSGNHQ